MGLKNANSDYQEAPIIPEDYYWGEYKELSSYEKEDGETRLNLIFEVEHEGEAVEVVFNTSPILSMYGSDHSSKLGSFIESLNLEEVIDESLEAEGALANGEKKFIVETEQDQKILKKSLEIALSGKEFRLNVVVSEDGEKRMNFIDSVSETKPLKTQEQQTRP